jgi:hypothetical protein
MMVLSTLAQQWLVPEDLSWGGVVRLGSTGLVAN